MTQWTSNSSESQDAVISAKMEAIRHMAASLANELNNLNTIIIGAIHSAENEDSLEQAKLHLKEASVASMRASVVVRQLSDFSNPVSLPSTEVEIGPIVEQCLRVVQLSVDGSIQVSSTIEENLPKILAHPMQLQQIILNGLMNACDAILDTSVSTPHVEISVGRVTYTADDIEGLGHPDAAPGEFLRIVIHDRGRGMSEDVLLRAYEPFFSTKDPSVSSGLGLSTLYGVVKSHQGWTKLRSVEGEGTHLEVYWPIAKTLEKKATVARPAAATPKGRRVLLVDDESMLLSIAERALSRAGFDVVTKTDGNEALEVYRHDPHAIDLVVTDLHMPRLPGSEVVRQVLELNPSAKIVITSGYLTDDEIFRNCIRVAKPYLMSSLVDTLNGLLSETTAQS